MPQRSLPPKPSASSSAFNVGEYLFSPKVKWLGIFDDSQHILVGEAILSTMTVHLTYRHRDTGIPVAIFISAVLFWMQVISIGGCAPPVDIDTVPSFFAAPTPASVPPLPNAPSEFEEQYPDAETPIGTISIWNDAMLIRRSVHLEGNCNGYSPGVYRPPRISSV